MTAPRSWTLIPTPDPTLRTYKVGEGVRFVRSTDSCELVAYRMEIPGGGPNGEPFRTHLALSWDDGQSWGDVPMRLGFPSSLWPGIAMIWPPDDVKRLELTDQELRLEFSEPLGFDSWFGRDDLPVWRATYSGRAWAVRRIGWTPG